MSKRSLGRGVAAALAVLLLIAVSSPVEAKGARPAKASVRVWTLTWNWLAGWLGLEKASTGAPPSSTTSRDRSSTNGQGQNCNSGDSGSALDPNGCPGQH